jgi:hypothetical protein
MAQVSQVYEVEVQFKKGKRLFLHFLNRSLTKLSLKVKSSKPELVEIITQEIKVGSEEKCEIRMFAKGG